MANETTNHVHRYEPLSYNSVGLTARCRDCGELVEVPVDQEYGKLCRAHWREAQRNVRATHKTWHAFCAKFMDENQDKFICTGWDLIQQVERWAKRRKTVQLVWVDDDFHMNSLLVLVEHGTTNDWMGLSAVMIPQIGTEPVKFFLYPNQANALYCALTAKRYRRYSKDQVSDTAKKLRRKKQALIRKFVKEQKNNEQE